jgi:CRP-like cAMP-binding protein
MVMRSDNHPLSFLLRKLGRWATLDDADIRAVLGLPYELRTIGKGNYVVRSGDEPTRACLLISGYAFRHKLVGNGGRQILALHMSGDMVDLQNALLRTADHNVQALTRAEVAFIPTEAVKRLAFGRPSVGFALWYDTLVDASIQREWTANVGRRDARTRLSHLLCEFGLRLQDAGLAALCRYELPMSQEELADALGLTAVHVNRTLKALDREGLTDRKVRSVFIRDWERLARAGDFSTDYLHRGDREDSEAVQPRRDREVEPQAAAG